MLNRKKVFLIPILLAFSQATLFAQPKATQLATVYLYQGKVFGLFSIKHRVYANGKLLCKLGRNSHCRLSLPTGVTTFTTKPPLLALGHQPAVTLTLEEGKAYSLQGDATFELVPPNSPFVLTEVVPNAAKLEQISLSKVEPSLLTPTN